MPGYKTGVTNTTYLICYGPVQFAPSVNQRMCLTGGSGPGVTPEQFAALAGHTKVYNVGRVNRHGTWYWVIEVDKKESK